MKSSFGLGLYIALLAISSAGLAQEAPKAATPEKEHEWLAQLAGEFTTDAEAVFSPELPPFKCSGTATARTVGGFWIVNEHKSEPMGVPMLGIMTVGYDPAKKKFVGTWVDSMTSHMWKYEGSLDKTGKILTLEAEGPSMTDPSKMGKYRDVIEVKSDDHRVLTSAMQGADGKWTTFMTMNYRRKAKPE